MEKALTLRYSECSLIKELDKLNKESKEAVEGDRELSRFKKYMHVPRKIEKLFIDKVKEVANKDKGYIIILVGDGKSHLISYFRTNYPDLYDNFQFHTDATESYHPKKTDIETLVDVLKGFKDENIDINKENKLRKW
ncbi:DNA phosphorothioation-dependent restriction protein DptF [Clostridium sp. CCUG 7971]|uniref:DNA phosphorothioation-dependent restriction protein DptF n=1 Tax=Clostridium sp. CCUG 7971 TaxID=2811414 RepID=UPI001ABB9BD9|nr:DNA phosphorothioation-dependent restriction protein DptF [Clostridium sp. CCUG 7971]MBO3445274.1 DNA phosphorothioation-dependent restriction protein DptF [Clostridium sp. CCUG 7971]